MLAHTPASAKPVTPGSTVTFDGTDPFVAPTGDVLGTDTRTVTLTYDPGTNTFEPGEDGTHDVTFTSQVLRDPATQRLTFVYRLEKAEQTPGSLAAEAGTFTSGAFGAFATDVTFGDGGSWTVNRAIDGSTLTGTSPGQGQGTLPYFVVATDATEFDTNGTMTGVFADEFGVLDNEGFPTSAGLSAPFALTDTFQPITGGGTAIPLPAGVWGGLVMLAVAGGALMKVRRALQLA
jgi:hypothetical protein